MSANQPEQGGGKAGRLCDEHACYNDEAARLKQHDFNEVYTRVPVA